MVFQDIILSEEGDRMVEEKIVLTPSEIYEKEFKVDARGYRPQEVDNYLDIIIRDYTEYNTIIRGQDKMISELTEENTKLKNEIRKLRNILEAQESSNSRSNNVNNIDLLRRISQLEKFVYGKNE
jgi:DivIVA domain-containing protein